MTEPPFKRAIPSLLAFVVLYFSVAGSGPSFAEQEETVADRVQLILRARLSGAGSAPLLELEGRRFRSSPLLSCFYERRNFKQAWSVGDALRPEAGELLVALATAKDDGLRAEDYRPSALEGLAAAARRRPDVSGLAELDLQLTNAFLTFAAHLRNGKVNPEALYSDCALAHSESLDLAVVLEEALRAGQIRAALAGLTPPHRGYTMLREALGRYRRAAERDSPPPVPPGPTLRVGDRGERISILRERLAGAAESDAAEPVSADGLDLFDAPLEEAVRGFQERRGLEPDGAAGPATLAELNQEPADHIRQITVNLERWRWMPRDLGRRHVMVNIAAFRLEAIDDGQTVLDMRVIVGKPYTRTPVFSSAMNAVVLNPSWYVPQKIAVNEILPKAKIDASYLQRNGYEVVSGSRLRQKPGPQNALGRIKFVFPNRFSVYLHDTPARTLFSSPVRTFSHGCIRIEKPFDLAVWALSEDPSWSPKAIRAGIDAGRERKVPLGRTLPVHVAYWTAWVDDRGALHLGRDVYQRDAELARLLTGEREKIRTGDNNFTSPQQLSETPPKG